ARIAAGSEMMRWADFCKTLCCAANAQLSLISSMANVASRRLSSARGISNLGRRYAIKTAHSAGQCRSGLKSRFVRYFADGPIGLGEKAVRIVDLRPELKVSH